MKKYFVILSISIVFCRLAPAYTGRSSLTLDPHYYQGHRSNEPQQQLIGLAKTHLEKQDVWEVRLHMESESTGRRDISLDIDRAWYTFPIFDGNLILGRTHPFEVSDHSEKNKPWGLLGSSQPQNRGVLLGYHYGESAEPNPILLGWLGLHYWSDSKRNSQVQWGISATPFFVPSMGSDIAFSRTGPAFVGRFARRPPDTVVLSNGSKLPIYFEIDSTNTVNEIVLQPQVLSQLALRSDTEKPFSETWFFAGRAPSPNPTLTSTSEKVVIENETAHVVAKIKPRFEERWIGGISQRFTLSYLEFHPTLFINTMVGSDNRAGIELGTDSKYYRLSLLQEEEWDKKKTDYTIDEESYSKWLAQLDLTLPIFESFQFLSGLKYHLTQGDYWIRAAIRSNLSHEVSLDLGTDIFTGKDRSYFGEWRTNDRIFAGIVWEIDK